MTKMTPFQNNPGYQDDHDGPFQDNQNDQDDHDDPFQDNPKDQDDHDDPFQDNPKDQDDHDDPFQDDQDCLSESWHCRLGNGQMGPWGSLLLSTIISTLSKTRKRQIHTLAMTNTMIITNVC